MIERPLSASPTGIPRVWQVGALCRAIGDALDARFNPVTVQGEISGFSRATSGHCYFSLKDSAGQIRCAMFKRAAGLMDFMPREGDLVDVRGRIDVYTPRGDLQLIVESMVQAGQGALFERFLQLKVKLEAEGLFAAARKRALPTAPRGIGLVTSLGAAALHDVVSTLQRRVPHIPVLLSPALVQGWDAPQSLCKALLNLYQYRQKIQAKNPTLDPDIANVNSPKFIKSAHEITTHQAIHIDVILLVRGGGSMEDLWAFNDENLARLIVQSPVPIISGIGHETDFTIADFVADLRAPTPTAAAELVCQPREVWLGALSLMQARLQDTVLHALDTQNQQMDRVAQRMGRPSLGLARQQQVLAYQSQRLRYALATHVAHEKQQLRVMQQQLPQRVRQNWGDSSQRLHQVERNLALLDPQLVLQRGYAWLTDATGATVTDPVKTKLGQSLLARLAKGRLDVTVAAGPGDALF